MTVMIDVQNLSKQFTLHNQGGINFTVLDDVSFNVRRGECVALHGTSGSGKSTLMRSLYANYKPQTGAIWVHNGVQTIDIANAEPRQIMRLREHTIGYVSQFLRVIPRVSTLDVVMEPLRMKGAGSDEAEARAAALLRRLNVPERLWALAPSTFSGGEQQRVNIARGFISDYPILLLDEPTASLDSKNRDVVVEMICEAKNKGTALVGIFHDEEVRSEVANRLIDLTNRTDVE
ncbi:phosphonate C-P lyase system protein PhnL [Alkalimarinus alittae]|uniref:Phosphonate C-P lyase system protein PhnL n=1 Tax=Alkalimarinus alittae TaxID=2961619 RepID=A0ABY6N2C6_9ALTE|nr:phosphonate C-P lyase system protein PhnL [Alkalimarinus alittae]UZE96246.1 phosphonate C-P lyase system protein PhnL [Alkalimarinus alittae]